MNELVASEYLSFIDELKATITEGVFTSRWSLIETYHRVGEMITGRPDVTVQQVSRDAEIPERLIQRCVQFYNTYPDMSKLPFGKNVSWHKIVNELLPAHKEKEPCEHEWETIIRCKKCGEIKND